MMQQSIKDFLKLYQDRFDILGMQAYKVDIEWLMCEVLQCTRTQLRLGEDDLLSKEDLDRMESLINRRVEGEPLQYIIGYQSFYGYDFQVNPDVLIPRFETEELVEKAIGLISKYKIQSFIDMCTGSGCIGLTLLKECKELKGECVDLSTKALAVAELNSKALGVIDRVILTESNLFDKVVSKVVDMIISNPPYIERDVVDTLEEVVKSNEPHLALDGGWDGLDFYRQIIDTAPCYLKEEGYLLFEIGYNQMKSVSKLMIDGGFYEVEGFKDMSGNDRMVIGKYSQS